MNRVRWGILSTSAFAASKFIPGLRRAKGVEVVAVGSRSLESAQQFAARTNISVAHGSYEALLADPNVDVIYNPLPNHLHVEWTKRAVDAGKHVYCEKPMALNASELETLRPYATRRHIVEGFMVRHHPQWIEVRNRIRSGEIGELTHAHIAFAYTNTDATNIRNIADVGGGALYDIGCYAVVASRWFFEADPVRAVGMADRDPVFHTDRRFAAILDLGQGRTSQFTVSTQSTTHQRVHLFGTTGRIEITIPFNQPQTEPMTYLTHDGQSSLDGLDAQRHVVAADDQYALIAEWFSGVVRNKEPTAAYLDDALINARILDALFRSEKTSMFEEV
jgi:predicted dehydrogenase